MNEAKGTHVITRFAPSPTGFMHIGGVRTALFAYLWARKNKGTFILRIEDTDKEREVPGSIDHIQASLRWLGLEWDYGPDKPGPFGSVIQSERLSTYREWIDKLIAKGLAYTDPYTQEEVAVFRKKAEEEKRPFLMRNHRPETIEPWDGKRPLRFKVPEVKRYHWNDAVRGELEAGEEALDDFILIKSDGYPTYNFAHIIDDHNMGVTHIMRADEFISSTPRFLSLYEALEITPPIFVTLPPILRDDRTKKLGKRDGAKDILEYKNEGYLPEAVANYLALIGWNPGTDQEIFSLDELVNEFDISKIQKGGGAFDEEKLKWFNREHIKRMSENALRSKFAEAINSSEEFTKKGWSLDGNLFDRLVPILSERVHTFGDVNTMIQEGELDYFFESPKYDAAKLVWKDSTKEQTAEHVQHSIDILSSIIEGEWSAEKVKEVLWPYAEEKGRGAVLWPLRYALSGKDKSPDPFTLIGVFGKAETLKRLNTALEELRK